MEHTYTQIEADIIQCNACGAHADSEEKVVHHKNCNPDWEDDYADEFVEYITENQ